MELWKLGPKARNTFYMTDGTGTFFFIVQGRDSYIKINNGGTVQKRDQNIPPISGIYDYIFNIKTSFKKFNYNRKVFTIRESIYQ